MTDESKIRLLRNRHPADQIADVRAEIKQLELREEELRQWLIAHPDDLVGETVEARLKISSRKRLDQRAVIAFFGQERLQRFLKQSSITSISTIPIKKPCSSSQAEKP